MHPEQADHILFDMDGTLTPARREIDPVFKDYLLSFCQQHKCSIVTGSDYGKVLEQLGPELTSAMFVVYACGGNVGYHKQRVVWRSEAYTWKLTPEQCKIIQGHIDKSKFWLRTGNHIEQRIGCANISVVGRNANLEERSHYIFWDQCHRERQNIIDKLKKRKVMKDLELVKGGETGIDIFPRGFCKAQVKPLLKGRVLFIGDRCESGGNDHTIAMASDSFYGVRNWRETYGFLLNNFSL